MHRAEAEGSRTAHVGTLTLAPVFKEEEEEEETAQANEALKCTLRVKDSSKAEEEGGGESNVTSLQVDDNDNETLIYASEGGGKRPTRAKPRSARTGLPAQGVARCQHRGCLEATMVSLAGAGDLLGWSCTKVKKSRRLY